MTDKITNINELDVAIKKFSSCDTISLTKKTKKSGILGLRHELKTNNCYCFLNDGTVTTRIYNINRGGFLCLLEHSAITLLNKKAEFYISD